LGPECAVTHHCGTTSQRMQRQLSNMTWMIRALLLSAAAYSAHAFAPIPFALRANNAAGKTICAPTCRIALRVRVQRDDSKTELMKDLVEDMTLRIEDAKTVLESKKQEVGSAMESAAEDMFTRFDDFRTQIVKEETDAKAHFARFDKFLNRDDEPAAPKDTKH